MGWIRQAYENLFQFSFGILELLFGGLELFFESSALGFEGFGWVGVLGTHGFADSAGKLVELGAGVVYGFLQAAPLLIVK